MWRGCLGQFGEGALAKKLWGLVRGPGEAELRGLETWRRRPWRRRTQIYFRVSSQGNWRGKCSLNPGRERQGEAGLVAGREEESTGFCLLIPRFSLPSPAPPPGPRADAIKRVGAGKFKAGENTAPNSAHISQTDLSPSRTSLGAVSSLLGAREPC